MRISDVSSASSMISQLQKIKAEETDVSEELTSGKKVENLEDDPALAQTLLNSQVDSEKLIQQNENLTAANSIAQAGVDGLSSLSDQIDLALEVADEAQSEISDDSTSSSTSLASSIDDIISDVLATANATYGDDYLYSGTDSGSTTAPYTYDETSGQYVYNGSGDGREVQVSDGVTVSPFTDSDGTQAILDTLNSLVSLKTAISSGDTDAISTASDTLSTAQDSIVDASSDLGTTQSRLELLSTRNSNSYTNLDDAEETATNADENESTVKLLAAQNAYSAALEATSLLMDQTILDYL